MTTTNDFSKWSEWYDSVVDTYSEEFLQIAEENDFLDSPQEREWLDHFFINGESPQYAAEKVECRSSSLPERRSKFDP